MPQADYFLKNIEGYIGDAILVLDWEATDNPTFGKNDFNWCKTWLDHVYEKHHEGIVSRELWDVVQRRLEETETQRNNGIYKRNASHFLFGRIICGECGEPMIRRVDKSNENESITWICKDRRKGKKGNDCKNMILPENELLEALTEALGCEWNGAENVDEKIFDTLKAVRIYEDGRVETDLEEKKEIA